MYTELIHFTVQQKLAQHFKANIPQFKKKEKEKKLKQSLSECDQKTTCMRISRGV